MFSVVIPLYNKELSIEKAIRSVLDQTFIDFEIIVVNDGSTDSSASIVEEINNDKIKIINQPNQGVSSARNRGIKEAKNTWVAFLDADDLWEINHLEEIVKMMYLFPGENVYITSFKYSDNRSVFKHPRKRSIFKIENYFKEAIKEQLICTNVIVINQACFNVVGGFNENINRGEDLDLWTRLARKFKFIKSSRVTAIYRVEAENRSNLSFDIFKSRVFKYSFSDSTTEEETRYYNIQITKALISFLFKMDFYSFNILFKKHWRSINILNLFKIN